MNSSVGRQKEINLSWWSCISVINNNKKSSKGHFTKKKKKEERKVKDIPREKEREHGQREPIHIFEEWECFLTTEL